MGQCIVKVAPDEDRYVVWSSIVDAPVSYSCTREQVLAWAAVEDWHERPEQAEAHVARADLYGSSDRAIGFGRWDDEYLDVMEGSPNDGWYHLRRNRLSAYMDALDRGDDGAAQAVLECWERFEGVDPVEN